MKKVKITAMRKVCHIDLIEKYENPLEHACDICENQVFISDGAKQPDGLCDGAWASISPFVVTLANSGSCIYGDWMKNPYSAMVACNDGFRPVSFLVEAGDEKCDCDI